MTCSPAILVKNSHFNNSASRASARSSRPTTFNSDRISASLSATFSFEKVGRAGHIPSESKPPETA